MAADRLPDDIERDLTLAHSDTCSCGQGIWPKDNCGEVREILRRAILAAMCEERASQHEDDCARSHSDIRYVCHVPKNLRARAAAIREGK